MAEPGAERAGRPRGRTALALARLLARESAWLARAADDPAAAERAARGLAWLAELARGFGAGRAAECFDALRARPAPPGIPASGAWPALGAPLCARLAREVRRAQSPVALADDARDWGPDLDALRAFDEPPAPTAPPTPVPTEPGPVPPLFLAVARFAGEREPLLDVRPGRVEISGEHAAAEVDAALLRALEATARESGAVLDARPRAGGGLHWRVIARAATGDAFVFVGEEPGPWIAVPAHRVVEPGPAAGAPAAVARLTFGHGERRCALDLPALHARLPAGLGVVGEVTGPAGLPVPIVDVVDGAATAAWAAAAPPAREAAPGAAPAEVLQPPPVPADNRGDEVRVAAPPGPPAPARRALVADDSVMARVFLARLLAREGFAVEAAEDAAEARAALASGEFDLAFLDLDMPGGGALAILAALDPARRPRVCALVKDEDERGRAHAHGLGSTLLKPFAEDEVREALASLGQSIDR